MGLSFWLKVCALSDFQVKIDATVTLVGFGTFSVTKREARQGRNPQNGDTIKIPAKNAARFKAGSKLAETLNES